MQSLCGRRAGGDVSGRGILRQADRLRLKLHAGGDRNGHRDACYGGLDGKMAEMADRAGVGRCCDMMMPDRP